MGRLRPPRRFAVAIAAAVSIAAALGADAWAQRTTSPGSTLRLNSQSLAEDCARLASEGNISDEAIAVCDRALRDNDIRPNVIASHMNRGNMRLRRQEPQQALVDFDAVIALDERHAEAKLNRGVALMMLEQPGPAVAIITEALSLGVTEPHKAYYDRAAAREALGDLRGAYEDYSTALEIQPDWGLANTELQRLARQRQEWLASALNNSSQP